MNFYAFSALINFLTSLLLGGFVFYKNKKGRVNIAFALFSGSVAFWSFGYFFWQMSTTAEMALFWSRMFMAGAVFIPITYFHFILVLTELFGKRKKFLLFSYLIFFIFFLFDFTPLFVNRIEHVFSYEFWPLPGPVYHIFLIVWFAYVIYATYLLFNKYKNSQGTIRSQIKYVFIGMIVGFAGGSTNYFLWYKIPVPPVANILVSVYVAAIAYSIIKYRLMDIRIAARKAFIYLGVATFTYGIFYLTAWVYIQYFGGIFSSNGYLAGIIIAPLFVTSLFGINRGLEIIANKYFFVSLYNYQATINKLSQELNYYNDLDKIIGLIVDTIKKTMQLDRAGVLLINQNEKPIHYQIAQVSGFNEQNGISLVQDNFLTKYLQKTQKPLVGDELTLLARDAKTKKDQESFSKLYNHMKHIEASLCLPLMSNNTLIGIIVLGAKISKDAYTKEDLELLSTLSNQAGIAVDNAKLYKEVKDFSKTLQGKVDEQTKYLKELLEIKSDFLRVVNHQLNTPLSVMKGYFSMMEEGSYPTEKAIPSIKSGLERISSTVADFWDAYELEGEKMKMEHQKIDITEIVDKLIPEKQKLQLTQERKLKIYVQKPKFKAPIVWCDYKKIGHVISNLLDNAVYYTRQGSVTVFYELVGNDYLKINVKDTGVGITEEDKEKIFQKFSRGDNATDLRPDGSGLGLFIAKKIVDGNDGEMMYVSEGKDKGSTFSFTVPIYKDQKAAPGEEKPVTREKKIVIFDKK